MSFVAELFQNDAGKGSLAAVLMSGAFLLSGGVLILMAYNKQPIDACYAVFLGSFTINSLGKSAMKLVGGSSDGTP